MFSNFQLNVSHYPISDYHYKYNDYSSFSIQCLPYPRYLPAKVCIIEKKPSKYVRYGNNKQRVLLKGSPEIQVQQVLYGP